MKRKMNGKVALITMAILVVVGAAAMADAPISLSSIAPAALSADEEAGILYMREEEKLARDVYLALNDIWQVRVFENIASAEQQHMDDMFALIERYELDDPALTPGVFTDPDLQDLYDTLVARGAESLEEALRVGALIEEVDIEDLRTDMAAADNEDILLIYGNLLAGSENHLRAFVSQIERSYGTYEPVVLDQDTYDEIIGSASARGGSSGGSRGPGSRGRRG